MGCILVAGFPAVGKSTLAAALSQELRVPMFSKDSIKEQLYDSVGFRSRQEKVALGVGAMEILYYAAGQVLAAGQTVILENNFENDSRPGLLALLEKHPCPVVTLSLTGDPEVIYQRFLMRDLSPSRHRGHVVNTCCPEPPGQRPPYTPLTLPQFMEGFKSRGMDSFSIGRQIVIDMTDFSKINVQALAKEITPLV